MDKEAQTCLQGEVFECQRLGHMDTRLIRVGHVTWRVVDQMISQIFRTWLGYGWTYFIGFFLWFSLALFFTLAFF